MFPAGNYNFVFILYTYSSCLLLETLGDNYEIN